MLVSSLIPMYAIRYTPDYYLSSTSSGCLGLRMADGWGKASLDTVTSTTLLQGLRDPADGTAWSRFERRYGPMVMSFVLKAGIRGPDADDICQDVMLSFTRRYLAGGYDSAQGRLRSFLWRIAQCRVVDHLRKQRRDLHIGDRTSGGSPLDELPSPDQLEQLWHEEWQRFVLHACLDEVRRQVQEQTYRAFDLYFQQGWTPEEVASHLDISVNSVYLAKNRVLKRLRELRPEMEANW